MVWVLLVGDKEGTCAGAYRGPGVGGTEAPFVNFSVSKIFDLVKVPVGFFESLSYLAGITAAELRRYLPNINVIYSISSVCFDNVEKNSENNGTEEIDLVTPTPCEMDLVIKGTRA